MDKKILCVFLCCLLTLTLVAWSCDGAPSSEQSEEEEEEEEEEEDEEIPACSITWENEVQITFTGAPSFYPSLGINKNTIHLAWVDQRLGGENREIFYNRSNDNGVTWQGSDTIISDNPLYSIRTAFAVNGETVYLFWRDNRDGNYEEYFSKSTNAGIDWGLETRITNNPALSGCPFPAVYNDTLNLFFRDNRTATFKIYQKRSVDGGVTWSEDTLVTPGGIEAEFPFPAINGNTIHLVWQDNRNGNLEIYYKQSLDGGLSWTPDRRLTNESGESRHPKIVAQDSNLHVVWRDNRDGSYEVYYKKSTDGGNSWSQDVRLTQNPGKSFWPVLAVSDELVHLLWCDERDGRQALYYMFSTDKGSTWSAEMRLVDCVLALNADVMSAHPIVVTDKYVHITFNDDRTGENEIYYKKGRISW